MRRAIRIAIAAVTAALVFASTFNALLGHGDIAILYALAAPLGLAAWGFARFGLDEAAVVMFSCVLIVTITLTLSMSSMGVHDHAVIAYSGILIFNALLVSRRAFLLMACLVLGSGALVFVLEFSGYTNSQVGTLTGWPALVDFLLITAVIGALARHSAEVMGGKAGDAARDPGIDSITGLPGRARFFELAGAKLRRVDLARASGVLVLADLAGFRRMNLVVGYKAADRILEEVARRVAALSGAALCGRVGDDEFAFLALGLPDDAAAQALARRTFEALEFEHAGVSVRASVGYAPVPTEAHDIEPLFLAADAALNSAAGQAQARFAGPAALG